MEKDDNILINFKKEARKREIKEKIGENLYKLSDWFDSNRETILPLVPVVIGGITTVVKVVGKHINIGKEKEVKDLYCYDRSLGHYWRLKRELSNSEWLEIDRRKKNGERLADILEEMKVLK